MHSDTGRRTALWYTVFSFISLLLRAALFAVTTSHFLAPPRVELAISSRLCVVQRNGTPFLTVRVGHPQGSLLSDFNMDATFVERVRTPEGEDFYKRYPLEFNKWPYVLVPITIEHRLSDGPLNRFGGRFEGVDGWIYIVITAYDEGLNAPDE